MNHTLPNLSKLVRTGKSQIQQVIEHPEGLTKIDDINLVVQTSQANCVIATIAAQEKVGDLIYLHIDKRLFDLDEKIHSTLSKYVAFLHEYLYLKAREAGETTSETTRKAVALMISNGDQLTLQSLLNEMAGLKFISNSRVESYPYQLAAQIVRATLNNKSAWDDIDNKMNALPGVKDLIDEANLTVRIALPKIKNVRQCSAILDCAGLLGWISGWAKNYYEYGLTEQSLADINKVLQQVSAFILDNRGEARFRLANDTYQKSFQQLVLAMPATDEDRASFDQKIQKYLRDFKDKAVPYHLTPLSDDPAHDWLLETAADVGFPDVMAAKVVDFPFDYKIPFGSQ